MRQREFIEMRGRLFKEYNRLYKILYEEGYCEDDEESLDEQYYFIKGRMHEVAYMISQLNEYVKELKKKNGKRRIKKNEQ